MNKNIPNYLSLARIVMSVALFFIPVMSVPFQIVYVLAFVTDMIDGNLARAIGAESELGRKLDSYADLVYLFAFFFLIVPWMDLELWIIIAGIVCFALKAVPFFWIRYVTGDFYTFHNWFAKIGQFGLMVLPFLFMWVGVVAVYVELIIMYLAVFYDFILANDRCKAFKEGRLEMPKDKA